MNNFVIFTFVLIQFLLVYSFYKKNLRATVYNKWFAWVVDFVCIFSGLTIMYIALFAIENTWVLNIYTPEIFWWLLFFFGSSQFSIHLAKCFIRLQINL